jgi:hypothetical protein
MIYKDLEQKVYLLVNGVLEGFATTTFKITATQLALKVGGSTQFLTYSDGYFDDIFMQRNGTIIDPTGFSVGEKVFEPPMRGQFDGTFKQYPIP